MIQEDLHLVSLGRDAQLQEMIYRLEVLEERIEAEANVWQQTITEIIVQLKSLQ